MTITLMSNDDYIIVKSTINRIKRKKPRSKAMLRLLKISYRIIIDKCSDPRKVAMAIEALKALNKK